MKNVASSLLLLALGVALGSAGMALAAPKTVVFTAPASVTARGGWQVCLSANTGAFAQPTALVTRTRACAYGDDGKTMDCSEHEERTTTPPAAYINFLNDRMAAWKTAKGY